VFGPIEIDEDFPMLTRLFVAVMVASTMQLTAASGQKVEVKVPPGTVYLDLDSKGDVKVLGQKQSLRSSDEVKKYLAANFSSASELVKKAEGKQARPVALIRVREPVEAKRIEALRKTCNEAGYRWGVDIDIKSEGLRKLRDSSPGYVTLMLNEKGEATVADGKTSLRTLDEIRKYLKEQAPRARAEGMKAKVDDAPLIQVLGPKELVGGELVKMLSLEDEKLGYNGHLYFWVDARAFALESDAAEKK